MENQQNNCEWVARICVNWCEKLCGKCVLSVMFLCFLGDFICVNKWWEFRRNGFICGISGRGSAFSSGQIKNLWPCGKYQLLWKIVGRASVFMVGLKWFWIEMGENHICQWNVWRSGSIVWVLYLQDRAEHFSFLQMNLWVKHWLEERRIEMKVYVFQFGNAFWK